MVGTVIVVGSAGCVFDDLERVPQRDPPWLWVAAVNGGCIAAQSDFIMSQHPDQLGHWRKMAWRERFCWPETHSVRPDTAKATHADFPWVDHWWPEAFTQATSAWAAVRICKLMGFDEIILAGCPLDPGAGYFKGEKRAQMPGADTGSRFGGHRVGQGFVASMREALRRHVADGEGENVYSMSGYTRELLGEPGGHVSRGTSKTQTKRPAARSQIAARH